MDDRIDLISADPVSIEGIGELQGHGHGIARYREERGGFSDLRQLEEVPGAHWQRHRPRPYKTQIRPVKKCLT